MSVAAPACRWLRWKGHRDAAHRLPGEQALRLRASKVPFTCLRTTHAFGPDAGPVAPEACRPGRGCFVEAGGAQR